MLIWGACAGILDEGRHWKLWDRKEYTWKTVKQFSDGGGGGKVISHQVNKIMLKQ